LIKKSNMELSTKFANRSSIQTTLISKRKLLQWYYLSQKDFSIKLLISLLELPLSTIIA
jgi:hypothetical protein